MCLPEWGIRSEHQTSATDGTRTVVNMGIQAALIPIFVKGHSKSVFSSGCSIESDGVESVFWPNADNPSCFVYSKI